MRYELPNIFGALRRRPPNKPSMETRSVKDVLENPTVAFCSPDALNFKQAQIPIMPGGPVTMGLCPVVYNEQPTFNRNADAGPVREFFRAMMYDNRVKHSS